MEEEEVERSIIATLKLVIPPALDPVNGLPPTLLPEQAQAISLLLSRLEEGASPTHVLQTSLKAILQVASDNLQTDLRNSVLSVSCDSPSPWSCDSQSCDSPSPWCVFADICAPTSHTKLLGLCRFSVTVTRLLSTLWHLPHGPHIAMWNMDSVISIFWDMWYTRLVGILLQVVPTLSLDSDLEWSCCLATMGVCLVVSEVGVVLADFPTNVECGVGGAFLQILNKLDNEFPSLLYQKYQVWECQEVGGASEECQEVGGAGQVLGTSDRSLVLKSVQGLVATLSTMTIIAKGCGHHQLTSSVIECALRLGNKSWQHIQQLCIHVPGNLPVHVFYSSLSSLLYLHNYLQQLSPHPSQRLLCANLVLTMSEQISALKDRVIQYHIQLSVSCLLQDQDAGHWHSSRPFHESERCSLSIQMWVYHMRGLQHDLYTYFPLRFHLLREDILLKVLGACVSHLASRYAHICPSPQRTALLLADVLLVLSCVASTLPHLNSSQQDGGLCALQALDTNCNLLLLVGALVSCSLQQLCTCVQQWKGGGGGGGGGGGKDQEWLMFVVTNQQHYVERRDSVSGHMFPREVVPEVLLPLHSSQYGLLLQWLLSDGMAVCCELCCAVDDVVASVLDMLVHCPHSDWALAAVCSTLARRESEGKLSDVLAEFPHVQDLLQRHLSTILRSHVLVKAACCHDAGQLGVVSMWTGLLEDLVNVPRPLQAVLLCMAGESDDSASLGRRIGQILASVLRGCVLASDPSHPCHALLLPTLGNLCLALYPQDPPPGYVTCDPTPPQGTPLSMVISPSIQNVNSPTLDPLKLASAELSACSLEEHKMAAQVLVSSDSGLKTMATVHAALQQWVGASGRGFVKTGFDPMKEYDNVAVLGMCNVNMLSQQKLMTATNWMNIADSLCQNDQVLKLIPTVRWEWQVGVASSLTTGDQSLVDVVNGMLVV